MEITADNGGEKIRDVITQLWQWNFRILEQFFEFD